MPKRLIFTVVSFHITAALLGLVALASFVILGLAGIVGGAAVEATKGITVEGVPGNGSFIGDIAATYLALFAAYAGIVGLVMIGLVVGIEVVVWGLRKLDYWAWITGIVISGLLIVSGFGGAIHHLVLGGLALWGLVDPDSVKAFKPDNGSSLRVEG